MLQGIGTQPNAMLGTPRLPPPPKKSASMRHKTYMAGGADFESEGREFESLRAREKCYKIQGCHLGTIQGADLCQHNVSRRAR